MAIEKAIEEHFSGQPSKAFSTIEKFLNDNSEEFSKLYINNLKPEHLHQQHGLFRIRTQDSGDFTRGNMFHIPFELRHKVTTQRYSIPGYPCLYLGSSIYVCWKELQSPPFDNVYIVRFKGTSNLKILDFGYAPENLADIFEKFDQGEYHGNSFFNLVFTRIIFFPLLAVCSVKVLYNNEPFKPEYIIPQIVLQYVKKTNDFDGIRFFSMHFDQQYHDVILASNFVFPVKTNPASGICEDLAKKFKMTDVLPWQISRAFELPTDNQKVPAHPIELVKNISTPYYTTEFGQLESKLQVMPATEI